MLPWKANEKLIYSLYEQLQAVVAEIEELKKAKQSNVLEAMKKMIVEAVVAELKAALLPDLIAEVKKTMNPPRPQGVV